MLAIGLAAGAMAAIALVGLAAARGEPRILAGALVYAAALVAVLGSSLAYRSATEPDRRRYLRRLDHAAIFALIAGSATPFALAQPGLRGPLVAALLWLAALAGIVFKLRYPIVSIGRSALSYVLLGWAALAAVGPALSAGSVFLIALGGALYSAGVPVLLRRSLRYRLAIWHGFVLAGAACHYLAILERVVSP